MLRGKEYLVKFCIIDIPHYSLPRVRNLEKVRAIENVCLVKIPESHNGKLCDILFPLVSAAALTKSFTPYVSIPLVLNAMKFIHICEKVLLLVELLINSLFFLHNERCRLFFKQPTLRIGPVFVL